MDTQNHNLCLNLIFISNFLEGKYTGIVQQLTEKKIPKGQLFYNKNILRN